MKSEKRPEYGESPGMTGEPVVLTEYRHPDELIAKALAFGIPVAPNEGVRLVEPSVIPERRDPLPGAVFRVKGPMDPPATSGD